MSQRSPLPPLSIEAQSLRKGIYEHYKGHRYHVFAVARHSETLEECVVYRAAEGEPKVWVRPLKLFSDTVSTEDQRTRPRFQLHQAEPAQNYPKVGVGIAVVRNGQVLLGKRRGSHGEGYWAFPGGYLEHKETIEACVKRELLEETNLEALSIQPGPWTNDVMEPDKHYVTVFMFVQDFGGMLKLREPEKCEGWAWFEWDKLPSPLFLPITSLIKKMGIENLKNDSQKRVGRGPSHHFLKIKS